MFAEITFSDSKVYLFVTLNIFKKVNKSIHFPLLNLIGKRSKCSKCVFHKINNIIQTMSLLDQILKILNMLEASCWEHQWLKNEVENFIIGVTDLMS